MTTAEQIRFRSNRPNLQLTIEPARFDAAYFAGKAVQFRDGRFRTQDRKLINFLRSHELFNVGDRGFWEEPAEKPEPKPARRKRAKSKSKSKGS